MRYFIYCRKSSEGEERQVLSLASQQEALAKAFGNDPNVEIVGVYEEAKSAKTPGRPRFAEMLRRIENGEADGIASWAPDRLARNSIDGGHIIYMLDRRTLIDLKFATYTFENNPQGKFMLGIMFNQSKYYSDALSENVKRGSATKVAMGWLPNRPPLGYLNCPVTRTIVTDPQLFPLVRGLFEIFLTGAYTPRQIVRMAQDDWGFRTPKKARSGGKPIGRATIYRMLSNPFYAGTIVWGGAVYAGKHQPVLTEAEFAIVRDLLGRGGTARPAKYAFTYGGLLTCGRCGRAVSAEHKVNRHGARYTYYHCAARSRIANACSERSIEERELDKQFSRIVSAIAIQPAVARWVRGRLRLEQKDAAAAAERIAASRLLASREVANQLKELTSLRVRLLIDDEEFMRERKRLEGEKPSAAPTINEPGQTVFELLDIAEKVSILATKWFNDAPRATKQKILKVVCSNPSLEDKKVSVQAAKPFVIRSDLSPNLNLRGVVDEGRTITREGNQLLSSLKHLQTQGKTGEMLQQLRELEAEIQCPGSSRALQETSSRPWPPHMPPPVKGSRRYLRGERQ